MKNGTVTSDEIATLVSFTKAYGGIEYAVQKMDELAAEGIELNDSKKDFLKFLFATFINTMEQSNMVSHRVINIPIELCREDA